MKKHPENALEIEIESLCPDFMVLGVKMEIFEKNTRKKTFQN